MPEIVVIFTCKTPDDIREVGGSGWWKVDPARVQAAGRVLLVHNAHDPRQRGNTEQHGQPSCMLRYATCSRTRTAAG